MSNERVTDEDVRQATGVVSEGDTTQGINIAEGIVTNQILVASPSLATSILFNIELYLAAHFFFLPLREGPLAAETINDTGERYHNIYGKGLNSTRFGQMAISLDPTGTLATMADRVENPQRKSALFRVVGDPPLSSADVDPNWSS